MFFLHIIINLVNIINGDECMKKNFILTVILMVSILIGCELSNTPTSKAEEYLSNYQMLDDSITVSYAELTDDRSLSNDYKERYEKLIQKQYRNLAYEVKEETIDGNQASVIVQIEVLDYQKTIDQYDKNAYSNEEYHDKVLDALEDAKEKTTYTINFTIYKDDSGNWQLPMLDDSQRQKLVGINRIS